MQSETRNSVKLQASPSETTGFFQMSDGFELFFRRWTPQTETVRVILAIHGTGGHSGFFRVLGQELSGLGVETFALDLRGFGYSTEKGLLRGDANSFKRHLIDVDEAAGTVKKRSGRKPFVLGHSHGCATALWYAANYPERTAGTILAAPPVESTSKVRKREYFKFALALLFARKTMYKFSNPGSGERIASEESSVLDNDPLATRSFSIRWLYGSKKMLLDPMFRHASQIKSPLLLVQGEDDSVALETGAKKLFNQVASPDRTITVFPGADHFLYGSFLPVDVAQNMEGRNRVTLTIANWLKSYSDQL